MLHRWHLTSHLSRQPPALEFAKAPGDSLLLGFTGAPCPAAAAQFRVVRAMPDSILFLSLVALGGGCGVACAVAVSRSRMPFVFTALSAVPSADGLGLVGGMASMMVYDLSQGHSLEHSLGEGIASSPEFFVVAFFLSGLPALIAGMVLQWLLQRWKHRRSEIPPPLPAAAHD
jgi:hypothetical protein